MPGDLPTTDPDPLRPVSQSGMGSKHGEIGAYPSAGLQLCRLPVRSDDRTGPSHSRPVDNPTREADLYQKPEQLHSQAVHVFDRTAYGNGETSVGRSSSYEAFSVAPKAALACSRNSRKSYSVTPISPSAPRWVVGQEQCPSGTTIAPLQHALQVFTDASNEGWGAHLGDSTARGVWSNTESHLHINLTVKSCSSGPQEFRASLQGLDCAHSNGQHNCSLLHQQRGRYEIRLSLCPPLETSVLVSPQKNSAEGSTHTR